MAQNTIIVTNPATGKFVSELPVHDEYLLNHMVENSRKTQEIWRKISFSNRLHLLRKLKRYFQHNYQELIDVIQLDTGKTRPDAMVDVISAVAQIHDIEKNDIDRVQKFKKPVKTHPFLRNKITRIPRRPKGLVGVITPWNLPLAIPAADIFPALFRGNVVIWKPSEYTPLTALKLEEIMEKIIGFPGGLLKVLLGYGETGVMLCEIADCIAFTGSCATGEKVKAICDRRRISYHLEMGGKAPAIVLPDADIERTAYALVYGAFANSGQYCKSFERVYVHRAIFNEIVERVLRLTNSLVPGKDHGPIIAPFQLEIIKRQVEEAQSKKAHVATGGQEIRGMNGNWYRPTVLLYVDHNMVVMKEETFGPVMPIMSFDDIEEVITLARDSHLGLNASIFTKDKEKFYKLAESILADDIGNIVGNDAMINWFVTQAPQCGRKQSVNPACGLERHGCSGYERFDDPNTIVWHEHPFFHLPFFKNKEPWWLPYNKLTELTLKALLWGF